MVALDRRPRLWAASATLIVYVWALLFWYLFFTLFAWKMLHVPMGLGGAIYPVLFSGPVLAFTAVYEIVVARSRRVERIRQHYLLFTLGVPAAVVTLALVAFCPMDTQMSFIQYVITQRLF
jgi:NAD/NADP transhydrogenase beta subunit